MPETPSDEVRLTWPGGGPIVVRGRLAWLIKRLAMKAGALQPKVDGIRYGVLEAHWGDRDEPSVRVTDTKAA